MLNLSWFVTLTAGVDGSVSAVAVFAISGSEEETNSDLRISDCKVILYPAWCQWILCLLLSDRQQWWVFKNSSIQISIHPKFYPLFPQHLPSRVCDQLPPPGAGIGPHPCPDVLITIQQWPLATRSPASPGRDRGRLLTRHQLLQLGCREAAGQYQIRWKRRKEQYTMMVSQKVRLLIMILCENHYDMMTISIIFRRGERIWLQVSLATRWRLWLLSATRAQERPQSWLHTRRAQRGHVDSYKRLLINRDISKVEPVSISTFGQLTHPMKMLLKVRSV